MTTHIALLRGINLGPNNRIPMDALRAIFERAGATNVRTFIQSGNVVFDAAPKDGTEFSRVIPSAIKRQLGFDVPVIVRTAREFARAVAENPFKDADVASLHIAFLSGAPTAARAAKLDPERSPGDSYALVGDVIYLCLPRGVSKTKLSNAYFDSALGVVCTMRNWRTATALVEMCEK